MDFHEALAASAREAGLNVTQLAAKIGRSEASARTYIAGSAQPSADVTLTMMREIPGLAERLGFKVMSHAA